MALPDFNWKQHDTGSPIECDLTREDGSIPDLTGAVVKFVLSPGKGREAIVNVAASILDPPTAGAVSYTPTLDATGVAGEYLAEWEVLTADGVEETFPNPSYLLILVSPDLG